MHSSLRACVRATSYRNLSLLPRQRQPTHVACPSHGCSILRFTSSVVLKHDPPTASANSDANDIPTLSERQAEKMRADPSEDVELDTPMETNKVDMYLASLRADGIEPVLADLESCKPSSVLRPDDRNYAMVYKELVERLDRSFTKAQLRNFCIQYGIERKLAGRKQRKEGYAEWIITKQWGWESLKDIERRNKERTEVISKKFTVSPHELFLLLGKDGSDLLQLSMDYKVHIAVESNPLSIKVEGLRGSLKSMEALILSRRKEIIQDTLKMPFASSLDPASMQQISRLANAFVENVGQSGEVLIYARNRMNLEAAKRVVIQSVEEQRGRRNVKLLAFVQRDMQPSTQSNVFAMYPFISHRANPSNTRATESLFRCRSVHDWLSHTLGDGDLNLGIPGEAQKTFLDESGQPVSIERIVHDALLDSSGTSFVKAATGHVVFSEGGSSLVRKSTLLPPLPGRWSVDKMLSWTKDNARCRKFQPSLPSSLINTAPVRQNLLHRVSYKCLADDDNNLRSTPSKVIHFEIALEEQAKNIENTEELTSITYDSSDQLSDTTKLPSHGDFILGTQGGVSSSIRQETAYMLACPERPMDVQLVIVNTRNPKESAEASPLNLYFKDFDAFLRNTLNEQPFAPLSIDFEGSTYTLQSSASVRRSIEEAASTPTLSSFADGDDFPTPHASVVRTVTESIFDLNTNQTTLTCELICDNPSSDGEWNKFMTNVDALTRNAYVPIKAKPSHELIGE